MLGQKCNNASLLAAHRLVVPRLVNLSLQQAVLTHNFYSLIDEIKNVLGTIRTKIGASVKRGRALEVSKDNPKLILLA